jgi:glycosyltransferase involved in cell wall biosynthesis
MAAPRPDAAPPGGLPISIAGAFLSASGLGEGARLEFAALDREGLQPAAFDLSAALDQAELPAATSLRPLVTGSGGSLIIHVNATDVPYALCVLGRAQVKGRRIIGYWAWEFPRLPPAWNPAFRFVHEIWVPSQFTKAAITASTTLPVHVVAHPLPPVEASTLRPNEFGIPAGALIVLNVFHLGSVYSRKNPAAAIAAFRRAFGNAADKVMVIKLVDPGGGAWARRQLTDAIAGATNIHVINRVLSTTEMSGLMAAADIIISLHRTEGFGLVPAQAMQLGKPVVATGWSGNLDFMTETNSALVSYKLVPAVDSEGQFQMPDQQWAEADVAHAAEWLRRLAGDADLRSRLGSTAAVDIADLLSPARFALRVSELLERR